ncbi:MATE family efflux transporter [Sulfurospirillum barnesii]|uniref:Multidrug-efflux transporter n=1 Tax=Sulfurospirillum barnesii (strain ATCC 700032 / DSM 10660 / SES-3) TaxID=760154 RepID=I3XTU8_SULBS|nr:MATE family efflux transporter [Sulfurospirillum barnesii]AFL67372.1 putative efflux protein, MATE family [Sulfurospirillum barnesii SES-3]
MNYKEYLTIAIPFVLSTVTQPLLGAVDTAVIGRLGDASYVGGVAIGTVIFNTMYWLFGFLRVGTSGFSSQSLGSGSEKEAHFAYFRPAVIAVCISAVFMLLQRPIIEGAFSLYAPDERVLQSANDYFDVLIWGAPFVLLGYVNLGWIMGRKLIKETMILQISTNVINIVLDILFVFYFDMGVKGVAYATLIAQSYGFVLGGWIILTHLSFKRLLLFKAEILNKAELKKIMGVNADLMIRTVCLLVMTNMFVARGNRFGVDILAANAILFQIQYIICYLFDGLSNASSIFAGRAIGAKNVSQFKETFHISNVMIAGLSVLLALLLALIPEPIVGLFTDIETVKRLCMDYMAWLILFPFTIGIGLVYYGIFTGATFTHPIRDSMVAALVVFLGAYFLFIPYFDNHGLWLAFILFSMTRSLYLYQAQKRLQERYFPSLTA